MFKLKARSIKTALGFCLLLYILALSIPLLRAPALNTLKLPLHLLVLAGREVKGLAFYHHNFILVERLKKENDFLKQKLFLEQEFALENARLKALLSFKQAAPYRLVAARIIARQPDSWSAGMVIDKGSRAGISRGMTVITFQGLVGRVSEVSGFTSKVMLASDPNFAVSALVERSRQEGLVNGALGANLLMRYLPQSADIREQDSIITSGINSACPKGLLIGTVVELGREFAGLSSYAVIRPAVNLFNLEEVLVIIS